MKIKHQNKNSLTYIITYYLIICMLVFLLSSTYIFGLNLLMSNGDISFFHENGGILPFLWAAFKVSLVTLAGIVLIYSQPEK